MTNKNELGQFDTPKHISSSLMFLLPCHYDFFIDLGAGLGNLSHQLHQRSGALIELDFDRFKNLQKISNSNINVIHSDVLDSSLNLNQLSAGYEKVLYLSNPPFHRKNSGYEFTYFDSLNTGTPYHQLDIAFLDKVLSSMNSKSSIAFIVSAPFIEFEKYKNEREKFIDSFNVIEVISLDMKTFAQAEVQSYAVIGHVISDTLVQKILLKSMDVEGEISDLINITREQAIVSLSYSYHKNVQCLKDVIGKGFKTVGDFNIELIRGSQSKKYFSDLGKDFIHTTDLVNQYLYLDCHEFDQRFSAAEQNDILISRVGRRSILRQSLVKRGGKVFTDSVYRLKTETKDNDLIWKSISSEIGQKWRSLHAQGKCAQYLTRKAIFTIPII